MILIYTFFVLIFDIVLYLNYAVVNVLAVKNWATQNLTALVV